MKRIYLDYAATTPMDREVLEAITPFFGENLPARHASQPRLPSPGTGGQVAGVAGWGNPGSLHSFGQSASAAVFKARQTIAKALGAHYSEIIFTGSATEANNLALRGVVKQMANEEWRMKNGGKPRIIISAVEHESILETAKDLAKEGVDVVITPVDKKGIFDLKKLKAALNENTVLVSVMYANNEVGTIQPIAEIAKIIRDFRNSKHEARNPKQIQNLNIKNSKLISNFDIRISDLAAYPLLHTDAVQAFQYLDCNVQTLGVDLLTLSSQKIYGPKGVGALYVRNKELGIRNYGISKTLIHNSSFIIHPIITGGGQEAGLRSGTENVPAIVGFAKAVELVETFQGKEVKRVGELRDYAWQRIKRLFPKAEINGTALSAKRLANNLNVYIPKISGEQTLVALDLAGIAISSGSACTARSTQPSPVLLAMGFSKERAKNSLRVTLGRPTTKKEIDTFLRVLKNLK